ncbi:DUF3298 and DUF4163 domain-containing protein [Candidatus Uhrbacteria bacterium]|nr:DUF3298 and DUF4163 domain-containing protein [Candidatus Uhrbacteria bacterium]
MRFSPIFSATLIGLAVAGAGCSAKPGNAPTAGAAGTSSAAKFVPSYEAVGLATRVYHKVWSDGEQERCLYELSYPQLEPSYAQDEEAYARWDRANRVIMDAAFPGYVATTTANEYDIQASGERYVAECKGELEDLAKELGEEDTGYMNYVQSLGYTTQLFQDGIVSLAFQNYSYTGGAHGLPWMTGLTMTLPDGKPLALGDIVKEESLKPFMQRVRRDLLAEWGDVLFEEAKTQLEGFVDDSSPITADQQAVFSQLEDFYLTQTGFVFFWNVYEIAPYAAGQQTIFLPFDEVRDLLKANSPIAPLIR